MLRLASVPGACGSAAMDTTEVIQAQTVLQVDPASES
jgi:hypothetical protein